MHMELSSWARTSWVPISRGPRAAVVLGVLLGCGSLPEQASRPAPPSPTDASLGSACGSSTGCESDLICAAATDIAGTCTSSCDTSAECEALHGDQTRCEDSLCVLSCTTDAECPAGGCHESFQKCVTSGACTAIGNVCAPAGKPCCPLSTETARGCATSAAGTQTCCLTAASRETCDTDADCCAPSRCVAYLGNYNCKLPLGSACTPDDFCGAPEQRFPCTAGVCSAP